MKLNDYILKLQQIQIKHGNLDCVYSKDDEGNEFGLVSYEPSIGEYNKDDREFYEIDEEDKFEINAVCIN